jgi:hypothetical protein
MQHNYHCNRGVILDLELVQFWLFLAVFGTPIMIVSNKKKHEAFIIHVFNRQYLRYNII